MPSYNITNNYLEIFELNNIYEYLKYFHIHIIQDIATSIQNLQKGYIETEIIVKRLINPLELEHFYKIVKRLEQLNINYNSNLQFLIFNSDVKFYKIVKWNILTRLNQITKYDLTHKIHGLKYNSTKIQEHYYHIYKPKCTFIEYVEGCTSNTIYNYKKIKQTYPNLSDEELVNLTIETVYKGILFIN